MSLSEKKSQCTEKVICIVQITDTHLFASRTAYLLGMNCDESLTDVLELVSEQQSDVDLVLCTGDLVQDASVEGYKRLNMAISRFGSTQLWVPGNHDILENISVALGSDNECLNKSKIIGNWNIIMLNSCVEGMIHGHLSETELGFLDKELAQSQNQGLNVLIGVHHNAVPIQSSWLQKHSLRNSEEFFSVIDQYSHVKAVLCGHIHQDLKEERKGVLMLGTPSTCIQFHPTSEDFKLDDLNPGYRWLELESDGSIKTSVERVTSKTYNIDFASNGY